MISLTFDDALAQHLDDAAPLLERHGLCGTFYTHLAAPAFGRRLDEWRDVAGRGHELGNHTIFHPADQRKAWVREGNALDRYALDRMRLELETANQLLAGLDGRAQRTFAYPCSNPILGHRGAVKSLLVRLGMEFTRLPGLADRLHVDLGSTQCSYEPLLRDIFPAARGGGMTRESIIPPVQHWNRFNLPSVAIDGWPRQELIEYVERGLTQPTWVILQFHGIGGGHHLDCDKNVFRDFVAWLGEYHADRVHTVVNAARTLWKDTCQPDLPRPTNA